MTPIELLLPIVSLTLMACLAWIWLRQKLYTEFPYFFLYVVGSIVITIIRLYFNSNYAAFFKAFWITEGVYALLALGALHEAFRHVFIAFYDLKWFRLIFPGCVLLLVCIFVGDALLHPPAQASTLLAIIISFGKVANTVKIWLFCIFALLAWFLMGGRWRIYPYGIALGFALSALGGAFTYWMRSVFGTKADLYAKYGPPVAYIVAAVVWVATCFMPQAKEDPLDNFTLEEMLAKARQQLLALKRIRGNR